MFDVNNQYSGTYFGKDRLGFTTPDPDGTEILRPFLTVPYPAPWLPGRRRDEGHPVGAQVVLSAGYLVGQDKNGALVPAGLRSGCTGTIASGAGYFLVQYGQDDVGMAFNPRTGLLVSTAVESVLIGCPTDAQAGATGLTVTIDASADADVFTIASGSTIDKAKLAVGQVLSIVGITGNVTVKSLGTNAFTAVETITEDVTGAAMSYVAPVIGGVTVSASDLAFAKSCDLIPGGTVRPVGYAIRNVFQYLGGVDMIAVGDSAKGIVYKLNGVIPAKFRVHNYMHEPGTAVQTAMGLRIPYVGETDDALNSIATSKGLTVPTDYNYDDFSRSFVHCTGVIGNVAGDLYRGASVVADDQNGAIGSGHFAPYNPAKHNFDQIIGRVIGIEQIYPIKDYADRVRTQFDRAQGFVGPFADRNPVTQMMGGSATKGLDYAINLSTKGLLRKLLEKGVSPADIPVECGTYVWIGVRTI